MDGEFGESWNTKTDEEKQMELTETHEHKQSAISGKDNHVKTDDEKLNSKDTTENDDGRSFSEDVDSRSPVYTPPHSSSSWSSVDDSQAAITDPPGGGAAPRTDESQHEYNDDREGNPNVSSSLEALPLSNRMADTDNPPTPDNQPAPVNEPTPDNVPTPPPTTTTEAGDTEPDKEGTETITTGENNPQPASGEANEAKDDVEPDTTVSKEINNETEENNIHSAKAGSTDISEDKNDDIQTSTEHGEVEKQPESMEAGNNDDNKGEATNQDDTQNDETTKTDTDSVKEGQTDEATLPDHKENGDAGGNKETKTVREPIRAGSPLATEELKKKMSKNEDLQEKLDSALGHQHTEKQAYKKLTEENARLQKHHDDMEAKYNEMVGKHVTMEEELETLGRRSEDQKDTILRLEKEIKILKETQGGDDMIKDLREKLIRLSKEQEEKDRKLQSLNKELNSTRDQLKEAQSGTANHENEPPKSKSCIIM